MSKICMGTYTRTAERDRERERESGKEICINIYTFNFKDREW